MLEKLTKEEVDPRIIRAIEGAQKVAKGPVVVVRNQKPLPPAGKNAAPKADDTPAAALQAPAANTIAA
ncbi:UNVERIFIED_ORG: hypothetical protein LHK14_17930 [Roseateles sp. XES5]|nr:hypothetical protein [Roseateles sp. XES5]